MDFPIAFVQLLAAGLLGILFLYNLCTRNDRSSSKKTLAPKVPGALPIIGHLHEFRYDNPPLCKKLGAMAEKYGPVYMLRLGMKNMLIVNSVEAIKECYTINDGALCSRPESAAGKYMAYNYAIFALSPYGPQWSQLKKLTKLEIVSAHRLEEVKHHRAAEIDAFIKDLHHLCRDGTQGGNTAPTKVVMCEIFLHTVINVMCRLISGRGVFRGVTAKDEEGLYVKRLLMEFNEGLELPVLSDLFPIPLLEWLDLQGHIKIMKHRAEEFDSYVQSWIDEHRKRRSVDGARSDEDFTDFLLSAVENGSVSSEYASETSIKAILAIVFLGGNSTIPICLSWGLSLLMNNEHVLKHVQEELDQKVGRDRWVEESDIENLVYLQAIIIETLRLYPPAPFGFPHEALDDCYVNGFYVPKGTHIIYNVWKVHRDPRVWIEPEKFMPERWLTSQGTFDPSKYHYEFITFSLGRRTCPGKPLALKVAHLIMARLLQGFYLSRPMDMPIDMTEKHTFTQERAFPLEVTITPRLHPKFYEEA